MVDILLRLICDGLDAALCLPGQGGQVGGRGGGCSGETARIIQEAVGQIRDVVEIIGDLLQVILGELHREIGLLLSDDAAHVLPSEDPAAVGTAAHKSGGAACDAARVVAHVLIADGSRVLAVQDLPGVEARNAAGVRDRGEVLHGVHIAAHQDVLQGAADVLYGGGGVRVLDVDLHPGGCVPDDAGIAADKAAACGAPLEVSLGGAVVENAGGAVGARNAADPVLSLNRSGEAAAADHAVVRPCDAARVLLGAGHADGAGDGEVFDNAALLDLPEETGIGDLPRDAKPGDLIPLAVKGAAEGGKLEVSVLKGNVIVEDIELVLGVGVKAAGFRSLSQVVFCLEVDRDNALCRIGVGGLLRLRCLCCVVRIGGVADGCCEGRLRIVHDGCRVAAGCRTDGCGEKGKECACSRRGDYDLHGDSVFHWLPPFSSWSPGVCSFFSASDAASGFLSCASGGFPGADVFPFSCPLSPARCPSIMREGSASGP